MDPLSFQFGTIVLAAVVFLALVKYAVQLYTNRRGTPMPLPVEELRDVQSRLARIEQIVETSALEVERIAEANRFIAKLVAERPATPLPRSQSPERVITPH